MKYCDKCGNELNDEAVVCPKCGCAAKPSEHKEKEFKEAGKATAKKILMLAAAFAIIVGAICFAIWM